MMENAKILLMTYPKIIGEISLTEEKIYKTCIYSHTSLMPTTLVCEKVLDLIEEKKKLIKLKDLLDRVLACLDKEEYTLIAYKFFNIQPIGEFNYSARSYYRKQNKALERFNFLLNCIGLNDNEIEKNYSNLNLFKRCKQKLCESKKIYPSVRIKFAPKISKTKKAS